MLWFFHGAKSSLSSSTPGPTGSGGLFFRQGPSRKRDVTPDLIRSIRRRLHEEDKEARLEAVEDLKVAVGSLPVHLEFDFPVIAERKTSGGALEADIDQLLKLVDSLELLLILVIADEL